MLFVAHCRVVSKGCAHYNAWAMAMRIIFMGTPAYSVPVLGRLLNAGHHVAAVVTKPDRAAGRGRRLTPPPVKLFAQEHGLPILQPPSLRRSEAVAQMAALQPQVIVVAAYGRILPPEVLAFPPKGVLNVHPSLIPRHRGPSPVVTALLDGDEVTGVTIILTDEGMDTGPVVAQQREPVLPEDTATVLTERLFHLGAELLVESLPAWEADRIAPVPQDESRASTTRLYTKADGEMDWALSARALERRLKAFDAWPGCHTRWRGRGLRVLEGVVVRGETVGHVPGDVIPMLGMADPPVAVVTGEGALGLVRLQLDGRRPQSAQEFLRGYRDFIGSRLPSGR